VALADAIEPRPAAGGPRVGLKWPNDLWLLDRQTPEALSGRKLGGILIESTTVGRNRLAVIGIGLNVLPQPASTPAELTHGYACLDELDPGISAPAALGRIARPLVDALVAFQRDGFPAFADRFAARDLLRGRAVTTTLADLPEGVAQGVAPSGALLVMTPQGVVRDVASGEVSVRLQGAAEDTPC
jgi:BirA family transcriptional regulator, biotin operon repressor / biotin---[acetyl-CoA-carboxylase] ligase